MTDRALGPDAGDTHSGDAPATDEVDLERERRAASAIYGTIVGSAVLAVAPRETVARLVASVIVTLLIYWAAERYARIMALRIVIHRDLTRADVAGELARGWELVSASFVSLGVLVVVSLAGAGLDTAVLTALVASTVVLCWTGWRVGGDAHLRLSRRLLSAAVAGAFGIIMIVLKAHVHH